MKMLQRMATFSPDLFLKTDWVIKKRIILSSVIRFLLFIIFSSSFYASNVQAAPSVNSTRQVVASEEIAQQKVIQPKIAQPKEVPLKQSQETAVFVKIEDKALLSIQAIAETGAIHLALLSLDKQQPADSMNEMWVSWERERIHLLILSEQNDLLVKRLNALPADIPSAFLYWAKTQQASALMKLQRYSKARECLTQIIWKTKKIDSEFNNKWLPQWRRIIIHSYLSDGLVKDALVAITRFRQDYGHGNINDTILFARVLLMNNLLDDALNSLAPYTNNPEAGMLHLLAQLRKDKRAPRKILQSSLRQMQGDWVKPELKIYLWSIVAEAAQRSDDKLSTIKSMEYIFTDDNKNDLPKGLFNLKIDALWDAYLDNAMQIGNKSQYLVGDDNVWFNAAQAEQAMQPINARSLYAFLILRGKNKNIKQQAITAFLASLAELPKGSKLVNKLFLSSSKFKRQEMIPVEARHYIVDEAIRLTNIKLASEIMASITTSPQGMDKFLWSLRRARVLVMGGNTPQSAKALINLLDEYPQMSGENMDKLIQVVFDMQTVKSHQLAYNVFNKIISFNKDLKRQREIYYWMADSKKEQKQYAEAASLYLKSAMLPDTNSRGGYLDSSLDSQLGTDSSLAPHLGAHLDSSLDLWGQTARYQAAKSLAKAGLIDDAEALYNHLLKITKDGNRIKLLKHELQQLWLLRK